MNHEEEEEREEFIARSKGVSVDALGQVWRFSNYASGSIPSWHPVMIGRRRGKVRTTGQDVLNAVLFMIIVFGTLAVALFAPGSYKLPATLGYVAVAGGWIILAHTVALRRSRQVLPHRFPHQGEKHHHVHDG